jgi:SAM-dependent methyltransferase
VDERIVEIPWLLGRLTEEPRVMLDAGASLNHDFLLDMAPLQTRRVIMCALSREKRLVGDHVAYVLGDLRHAGFRDESFDEIVCISTLEHVGLDSTRVYSRNARWRESRPDDYREAVREFRRLLKRGGRLLLTVPYGRYENHGWLQQFDRECLNSVLQVFGGQTNAIAFYKYLADGWQLTDADACGDCRYFDIQSRRDHEADYVAAARAVACMELVKA